MLKQKLIYQGKTKDVWENDDNTYTLKLKDDATGTNGVFDPGANTVGLTIKGLGLASLKLTDYYFTLLEKNNIPTHYLGCNFDEVSLQVKKATMFGSGLEFVCRLVANGSFIKRYGAYATKGQELDYIVEVTLKDDQRGDPPISCDILVALDIMSIDEYELCKKLTKQITKILAQNLQEKSLTLHDIKYEFGKDNMGNIMLIDEISGGCMRVYKDGIKVKPTDIEV